MKITKQEYETALQLIKAYEKQLQQEFLIQKAEKYAKEKCRRCNANRVIKIEVHTRAADELSVWQYKCRECSHTWSV